MPVVTPEQCREFMKSTIQIAVTLICFKRSIFPPTAFGIKRMMEVDVKCLDKNDKNAYALSQALELGVFDAIDKGFLREVILGIFLNRDAPMELIESYNFRISTSPSLPQSAQSLMEEVNRFTSRLLGTLSELPSLPEDKDILLRCFYKSNAPESYVMPYFSLCKNAGSLHISSEKAPYEVSLDRFETPYEAIGLKLYVPDYITLDPQPENLEPQKEHMMLEAKIDEILTGRAGTKEWALAILHRILSLKFPISLKDAAHSVQCSVYRIRKVAAEHPFIKISKSVLNVADESKRQFALQCTTRELTDLL
ncbi:Hop1 [Giardia lamblia P15]|uniref:Hop1 n=1 Tax=Giardia intestinalis (strain P15) TaxID=658858 RepID=E1F333_GIAIA|nr:Hop1 [Giardia lamblia P15]